MNSPSARIERFLAPGDFYFGGGDCRIFTVLGSCVAITFWHPQRRIGGICHYLLPGRAGMPAQELDGRYADEALRLLLNEIEKSGTRPAEYEVKAFGGGNMFPSQLRSAETGVGAQNIAAAHELIKRHLLRCAASDLGGIGHRNLIFDIGDGTVWVRKDPSGSKTMSITGEDGS